MHPVEVAVQHREVSRRETLHEYWRFIRRWYRRKKRQNVLLLQGVNDLLLRVVLRLLPKVFVGRVVVPRLRWVLPWPRLMEIPSL
jgi:hypothetical protein